MTILPRFAFPLVELFRSRKLEVLALGCAVALLLVALCTWMALAHAAEEGRQQLQALGRQAPRQVAPAISSAGAVVLPVFSSAAFASQFNQTASELGVVPDEISYALEVPPGQPYQRYRITLPVKSGYPKIRRLVAALAANMPHVVLDGVRCTRENTQSVLPACELTFSAFFRLESNG